MRVLLSRPALVASVLALAAACSRRTCELPAEQAHTLNLARTDDREHFAADLANAQREAIDYGRWAAKHPPSDSRFVTLDRLEQHARAYCQALLAEKISAIHGIDLPTVEHAFEDAHAYRLDR